MPRQAHGRPLLKSGPSQPSKRKPQRNVALNALETAERQNPEPTKIRQHRLGEVEDDSDVPEGRADTDRHSRKRRKVTSTEEEGEDIEEGSDLEGGTWHTGVNDDDDDSDLDSDEAFGESDEEKFADFTFRGSEKTKSQTRLTRGKKAKVLDLEEEIADHSQDSSEDGSIEDDLGDEAVDLAAAWDLDDADQLVENTKATRRSRAQTLSGQASLHEVDSSSAVSDGDESTSDNEDDESRLSVSEDELEGDTAGLRTFVEGLAQPGPEKKRQAQLYSGTLPSEPSRFGLPASKLSAADLLQYVKDPTQRQSLKILQSAERSGPEEYRGGISGKLSAPLAKRQQDRLDRGAAYDKSKETLNRWVDTVKQNRRAEHLSFPMISHEQKSALGQKQLMPTNVSVPATNLEATINQIMEESGMTNARGQSTEDQEQAFEELAEREMDFDEVKARRAELRMARELMFREEIRAKRIKKIKSKAFRRVHRKERGKAEAQQREALAAAGLLNSDDEREKQDRRRAEERMGARHRESKWAKGIKEAGRATWDEDARAGVSDLARRDEDLRRRILGKDITDPDSPDGESDSESDYGSNTDDDDHKLSARVASLESGQTDASKSKLGQMAFMQRAEALRKAENDEELRQIRNAMSGAAEGVLDGEDDRQDLKGRQKFGVRTQPRFGPQERKAKNEFEAHLSDSEDETRSVTHDSASGLTSPAVMSKSQVSKPANGNNNLSRKRVSLPGSQRKSVGSVGLDVRQVRATETALDDYTSPSGSEDDVQLEADPDRAKAALAASIFAGPEETEQDFVREKQDLVVEEGDQVVDNTLPGWGSWGGAGISKRDQKRSKGRFLTTIKGVAPEKRQDAKLDRVIINEKRVKKNARYLATELPHPFETRQQYERSLRLPIGPEWSTVNRYQDAIKPRVLLKQGTVIRPIAKPVA